MAVRVALVSCVKQKRSVASAARDLYCSALFRGLRAYAERHSDTWYVLSAKYGVLDPQQHVDPYEQTLNRMRKAERLAWAQLVQHRLLELLPAGAEVIMLAGARYRQYIEPFLRVAGFNVRVPFEGLKFGEQLKRLKAMFP